MRVSPLCAALAFCLAATVSAAAAEIEQPPTFAPNKIPGVRATGANYSIAAPVRSDGFLRIYTVRSAYGDFTVTSDAMMAMRIRELAATAELDKITQSDAFNRALGEAGLAPIKFAGQLIVNPVEAIGNTLAGIGNTIGQVGSSIHNAGKSQDQPFGGFGADQKRRELAARLVVDPYSDFAPLQQRMQQLSQAAATGGLVVSGAMMAIPGAAGIVISNAGTSSRVADAMRDYSAAQLMDRNREKMLAMGLDNASAEALLANRNYTPLDMTSMVAALETVPAEGRADFLRRAIAVKRREAAFFNRRYAEMVADHHARSGAIVSFVSLGDLPFNQTSNGVLLGLWPVDALSWTENTRRAMGRAAEAMRGRRLGRPELRISGQATARAKQGLSELGFSLADPARR